MSAPFTRECPLADALAARLRASSRALTGRWLERIASRVSIEEERVFPTEELLDHVQLLIIGVADYLASPANQIAADMPVVAKAMELGTLRHDQGFDAHEIMKEYEILGGILFAHLTETVDEIDQPCEKSDLLDCGHRLFRAISVIQQTTTNHFLRLADAEVAEREDRLRAFNRAVSHEIKNRIGAVLGASETLQMIEDMPRETRVRLLEAVSENARGLRDTVEDLIVLSRERDTRKHRHVRLPEAAREAIRQVRDAAQAAGVEIRLSEALPDVEVNAAAVELCLTNYLTNAIKYAAPDRDARFAEISATVERGPEGRQEIVLRVRDNGLGVPSSKRDQLFRQFFRAHDTVSGADGTGLGLSIVRDTTEALGGRAWAEFPETGSVFAFALPSRRAEQG
jgi:signal transduction histidine kinase